MNCLIVEDEPLATDVLVDYIRQVPFLLLKATCSDAILALDVLQREQIDLVFLDIHLPGLKGLDFLKTLKDPPAIILTTAYHQYAVEGYELNVVDYLLKPIEFKRFLEAVNKVKGKLLRPQRETIAIHADKKTLIIPIDEIMYIESQKEYIRIQTIHSSFTTKYGLSKMEEELRPSEFLRVHRSFIVALSKIKAYSSHDIELDRKSIPIGGNYRELVATKLKGLFTS
ncbi:MAG TPA: LytTR family DNA-binding domain-containing protein [Cyclobacteriaceae bacterium]|nr:LytTR family DNA-binding domain-containing protein [Cyclobacteriaceae bacterium]